MYEFLRAHPSETILLSLKREGPGSATDQHLSQLLHTHYTRDPSIWYTGPSLPTLGQCRGKIILFRRFTLAPSLLPSYGLDASVWPQSSPHAYIPAAHLSLQDYWAVLTPADIPPKLEYIKAHLRRSAACVAPIPGVTTDAQHPVPPNPLFVNFLTGSNFWRRGCWPDAIAAKVNGEVVRWLAVNQGCEDGGEEGAGEMGPGDGGTGVVVADWIGGGGDWALVKAIVGWNVRLAMRTGSKAG
jgi:1-phosphatidylinositol phosphodiesterase